MNQQCKVCGEPAAGFHFGAFTCEGCKSFFGRTYNNLSSISECKNNGECVINKKNRTSCKACRLRKCLKVGMSKSGSRYGRRSNWFKIHCLLQEQQQNKANNNNNSNNHNSNSSSNNNDCNNSMMNASGNNSNLLQNELISSHFLANLYKYNNNNNNNNNNIIKNQEIKRQSSPSDSGASSADLDENSIKSSIINNNNNNNTIDIHHKTKPRSNCESDKVNSIKFDPLLGRVASINNLLKPISSFLPYNLHQLSTTSLTQIPTATPDFYMLQLPQISITPNPTHKLAFAENVQNEPIDLSLKSTSISNNHVDNENGNSDTESDVPTDKDTDGDDKSSTSLHLDGHKPVPLDLTLVRANPITG